MPLRKPKRQWLYVGCLIFFAMALVAVMVFVHLRKPTQIIPPESPEVVAKRESPKNVYKALAAIEVPEAKAPDALVVPTERNMGYPQSPTDAQSSEVPFVPLYASLGDILQVNRPDDDPELLAYLDSLSDLADEAVAALDRTEYYVPPLKREDYPDDTLLHRALLAKAVYASRVAGDDEQAFACFMSWLKLRAVTLDGHYGIDPYGDEPNLDYGTRFLAFELASATESLEVLRGALERLDAIEAAIPTPREVLETALHAFTPEVDVRTLEYRGMRKASDFATEGTLEHMMLATYWGYQDAQRLRRYTKKLRDRLPGLLAALDRPYYVYEARMGSDDSFLSVASELGLDVRRGLERPPWVRRMLVKLRLILALELCQRLRGAYPASLDDLTPAYLPQPPKDPLEDMPFRYQRGKGGYEVLFPFVTRDSSTTEIDKITWPPWLTREITLKPWRQDEHGHTKRLPAPRPSAFAPSMYRLGPYDTQTEPSPQALLALPPSSKALSDYAHDSGVDLATLHAASKSGLLQFGDAFDLPRAQTYYLLTYLHAKTATAGCLSFGCGSTAHLWIATDNVSLAHTYNQTDQQFPWIAWGTHHGGSAEGCGWVELRPGVTPVLIRLVNRFGKANVKLAFQDESGNMPEGVEFLSDPK